MSVALADVWGEADSEAQGVVENEAPVVSSKRAVHESAHPLAVVPTPPDVARPLIPTVEVKPDYQEMILRELKHIRMENTRRCTVYLAMAGLLFAILIYYIDILNRRLKTMNQQSWSMPQPLGHRSVAQQAPWFA